LGRVRAVRPDPSVDTMVIETPSGETVEQPIGDAWVGAVDVAARRVELINDDGLIR
jgi:ribosomal 30S subunit maturation factor RimM